MNVFFSLIVCTYKREQDLQRLITSLCKQTYKNFELIIVDQNLDQSIEASVKMLAQSGVKHKILKADNRVLSKCRNMGVGCAQGNIIAFPDDDCWYPERLLEDVKNLFSKYDVDMLGGRALDPSNNKELISSFPKRSIEFSIRRAYSIGISVSFFFKKQVLLKKLFNENLGAGSALGSGEETDLIIRSLMSGFRGRFEPSLIVYHPFNPAIVNYEMIEKSYKYALGFGFVLRKHFQLSLLPHFLRSMIFRPFVGILISIHKPLLCRQRIAILFGRWRGFFGDTALY